MRYISYRKKVILKSSIIWNQPCSQVNELIILASTDTTDKLSYLFSGSFVVKAILGIVGATRPDDTAVLPHGYHGLGLLASGWFYHWTLWTDWLNPDNLYEHTADSPVYNVESVISLIIFHYLGFHAGFKEIIPWLKKAWESVWFISACVQVELCKTCPR